MIDIGLAHFREHVIGGLLVPAFTGAENHFQIVGHVQAGGCVKPFLASLAVAVVSPRAPDRLGEVAVVGIEVCDPVKPGLRVECIGVELLFAVHVTEGHFVLAAQERERAIEADAVVVLGGLGLVGRREREHARAAVLPGIAGEIQQGRVAGSLATVVAEVDLPVVGKRVVEVDEVGFVSGVPLAPVSRRCLRAAPVSAAAIGIPDRQATPHWRFGVAFLMTQAEPQGGVGRQVDVHRAIKGLALVRVHVDPGVALIGLPDKARANRAFLVQRRGHIGLDAIGVPSTGAQLHRTLQFLAVGALAHHVEGCGRVTRAGHQTVGAAYHFNAVIHGQTAENLTRTPWLLIDGRYAIDHQRVEFKTTGVELGTAGFIAIDRHTGGVVDHVEDGFQILVLNALLGDDADGLRCFAQRHGQRRGRARSIRRVRVSALGNPDLLCVGSLGDCDRVQGQSAFSRLLSCFRRLQGRSRDGDTGRKHVYCESQRPECQGRTRGNGVFCTQEDWGGHANSHMN
ncbi:hypothetical protein D3C85_599250 [compost metagenome]